MSRTIPACCLFLAASVGLADDAPPSTLPKPLDLAPPAVLAELPSDEPSGPIVASPEVPPDAAEPDIASAEPARLVLPAPDSLRPVPLPEPLPIASELIHVADSVPAGSAPFAPIPARVRISDRPEVIGPDEAFAPTRHHDPIPVLVRPVSFPRPIEPTPAIAVPCPALADDDECEAPRESPASETTRLRHLLEAARHLEAAGRSDLAPMIRKEVDVARRLREKQRQLAALKREIDELRELDRQANFVHAERRQVMIQMQILEIGTKQQPQAATKPNRSERGLFVREPQPVDVIEPVAHETTTKRTANGRPIGLVEADAETLSALAELLRSQTGAKVLSRPTVRALDGREATIQVGGAFPVPLPYANGEIGMELCEFGTKVDIVPRIGEDDRIRIELAVEISERDFSNAVTVEGISVPGLNTRRFRTTAEVASGRGMLVWGPERNGVTTVLVLQPEIVEPEPSVPAE